MADMCTTPDGASMWTLGLGSKWFSIISVSILGFFPLVLILLGPKLVFYLGSIVGYYLRKKTAGRRAQILDLVETEEKEYLAGLKERRDSDEWENVQSDLADEKGGAAPDRDWDGIVGFFHPFCNAGGGGERVLWAAIRATQRRWPKAKCIVYTGDHDVDKNAILARVKNRFNIHLHPPTITFMYLTTRSWVLASSWPHFTLLGQSIGSLVLAWDAFSLLPPDIFLDTMGYAFALGFSKILFGDVPTGAYVHYPTISTDMLSSLDPESSTGTLGVNAGKGQGAAGAAKKIYWEVFAKLYSFVGSSIDVVMTNSTWTQEHINSLWGGWRKEFKRSAAVAVYPPVAVEELEKEVEVSAESEEDRQKVLLYIAQFRPEKNHKLIMAAFAEFMATKTTATEDAKLVLIGSVRDDGDAKRVYELRLLANELQIRDSVEFHLDASWPEILEWLRKASIGVNGMWNEHFGIGVVEYQAAGLISVVHNSGGPKRDIVIEIDGKPTGFHATTSTEFADGFEQALSLPDKLEMRLRARKSAKRFTEEEFIKCWIKHMEVLVKLRKSKE
ncbi:UDP-Glycosyltransferase/glycogen phosphorylase [Glarea lozoyensis ATCC 20868]|uniref:GDP-Man:Man(3)GlcNAc(2)-PP-Dol alpha-1,2-mannosyltransferase n=1 Tax=Glarea lozoyensis (strain ATCC 20868 / MF5171) TaxID=1116229 RepID=S3DHD6_GLAL2|nr:UDP-Glycosyltransferase/glycogen phosphorylase [Glarea lozoyensis ATCC 20868]EPE36569.1 UDP-Glycosyltransferase/glycogen phosphorylase [Glarea lozoyensis ATCC 20868]